jgi:excisionase family DNA binding protein
MGKVSTEYYNLEKVAEVLSVPTAEVNRLREQNKLRGFRDGTNWKFNREDVHTYLAASIKARSGTSGDHKPGDSDFDLAAEGSASSSSFDLLMEDAALPSDDDLVSVAPSRPKSDLDLAALDQEDDLSLAEETQISSLVVPKKVKPAPPPPPVAMDEDDSDSDALLLASKEESSLAVALDDEESVLGGTSGSSPQLGLAGDSGFDMLVAGESEVEAESDALLEVEEKTEISSPIVEDFTLEPLSVSSESEDSESSSQVIAIDIAQTAAGQDADPFGHDGFGDFVGFDSGATQGAAVVSSDPFGSGTVSPDAFVEAPVVSVTPKKAAVAEEEYSTGVLVSLVLTLVVMGLPAMMILDTMMFMWSWEDRFSLSSALMGPIAGLFGL